MMPYNDALQRCLVPMNFIVRNNRYHAKIPKCIPMHSQTHSIQTINRLRTFFSRTCSNPRFQTLEAALAEARLGIDFAIENHDSNQVNLE